MPTGVLMPGQSPYRAGSATGMVQVFDESRELQLRVHLLDELFVGHAGAPLLARLEHDGGVVHIERGVVGRAVRPAHRSEHR